MWKTNQTTKVICNEQKLVKHSVLVKDDDLTIESVDKRKWYDYIGINFGNSKIIVYIPEKEYNNLTLKTDTGDVEIPKYFKFQNLDIKAGTGNIENSASAFDKINIKTSTGHIKVKNINSNMLNLNVSTGKVVVSNSLIDNEININVSIGKTYLNNTKCKNITSNGDTGDIILENVIALNDIKIKRSTGDVIFDECDATNILLTTSTGDITGELLTEKIFFVQSNTGRINVPKTMTGGKCEINTDTGNIKIDID